jgi:hypothetical protein
LDELTAGKLLPWVGAGVFLPGTVAKPTREGTATSRPGGLGAVDFPVLCCGDIDHGTVLPGQRLRFSMATPRKIDRKIIGGRESPSATGTPGDSRGGASNSGRRPDRPLAARRIPARHERNAEFTGYSCLRSRCHARMNTPRPVRITASPDRRAQSRPFFGPQPLH